VSSSYDESLTYGNSNPLKFTHAKIFKKGGGIAIRPPARITKRAERIMKTAQRPMVWSVINY